MKKGIYLITGVMASGKSTIAELLASRLNKSVHLRGDVFRRMIVSGREEMSAEPSEEAMRQLHMRYRLAVEAAKTYYNNGFTVVLQDNYYGEQLSQVVSQFQGYPLEVIVLCPNMQAIEQREKTRGKRGYTGFAMEALYEAFVQQTPRIGFWLDTSNQSPAESVDKIMAHFQERGSRDK